MIFIDFFFVNNRDLSSQIEYVICLIDFTDAVNILYWFSIKCKRVTKNVFVFELYIIAHDFDLNVVLKATLSRVLQSDVFMMICTDSKSLYEYFVKLGITHEKRLMIDVMSLRQLYKRREITEVRWIKRNNNSADSMTKNRLFAALKTLIDTNRVNLATFEWMKREIRIEGAESSRWSNLSDQIHHEMSLANSIKLKNRVSDRFERSGRLMRFDKSWCVLMIFIVFSHFHSFKVSRMLILLISLSIYQ